MHSPLDTHFSLSSQSLPTLQSKVAALEKVYETWTAGDAGAEEEEDETDDDNHNHKGVCFHTGEPQCEEEVPAKARRPTMRWDGVTKGMSSEDPFAELNWVKGNPFTSAMHSGLHTLHATQVGTVGEGGPDVDAMDDETQREVMKILRSPSWDYKQVSRPIFQRPWQDFHDSPPRVLMCPLYTASFVLGVDVQGHLGRHHETHETCLTENEQKRMA